jgi:hypothetical protein
VQGRVDPQREILDVESVAGHLLPEGGVFAFLAAHRHELFPEEMFADLFKAGGRPSVPAEVMASVIVLQTLNGFSDAETVEAVTFDLRWKAACGLPVTAGAFHPTTLTVWRGRLRRSQRPNRIFDAVREVTVTPEGGLGFWAPADGVTTENSSHARTELNSLTSFTAGQGVHTLSASVTLQQEPSDGRGIIVGQIHGAEDIRSVPYVMVRYQQGRLRVAVKQVQDGDDVINYPLLDGLTIGDRFDYTLSDTGDGNMVFTAVKDGVTQRAVAPVPAEFTGATVRFQAGDYQLANTSNGADDGGRVTFHRLIQQP